MLAWMLALQVYTPSQVPPVNGWTSTVLPMQNGASALACSGAHAYICNYKGELSVWSGGRWEIVGSDGTDAHCSALAAAPDGHVFVDGGRQIHEWTGTRWVRHTLADWAGDDPGQMIAPSSAEVYLVGRGRVGRGGSGGFQAYDAGTWRSLTAVALVGSELWVGGQGGTVMRLRDDAWTRLDTRSDRWIRRLVVVGANDVWALADGESYGRSSVLHWDGTAWERRDGGLPEDRELRGIVGAGEVVYATGASGIFRWSAGAWVREIDGAMYAESRRGFDEACLTDGFFVVSDFGGYAWTRPR